MNSKKNLNVPTKGRVPKLRFPEFSGEWVEKKLEDIAVFSKGKGISKSDISENGSTECVRYGQLYTHYKEVINEIISRTNLEKSKLVLSEENDVIIPASGESQIDIATASCVKKNGVALGGDLNIIKSDVNGVFLSYYLNNAKKLDIAKLAQGISVVHLYASQLKSLKLNVPAQGEQKKTATFLSLIDERIQTQSKIIEDYKLFKKGMMQKIFNQELRFKDENGNNFSDWEKKKLVDVLYDHKLKNKGNQYTEVFSVSKEKGVINQIEHLGRSYSSESIEHYKLIEPYDLTYTKSPTSDFPYGVIKQNQTGRTGVLSPLYGVFRPLNPWIGTIIHSYFLSWVNTYNYLNPLVHKGAKNTMNINNDIFLNGAKIWLPADENEQKKIALSLSALDKKLEFETKYLTKLKAQKQYLLQNLFI